MVRTFMPDWPILLLILGIIAFLFFLALFVRTMRSPTAAVKGSTPIPPRPTFPGTRGNDPRDSPAPNVQFTIYRPKAVEPDRWYVMLAFAHAADKPVGAPPNVPDPVEEVREQAHRVLGVMSREYAPVAPDDAYSVPSGSELAFVPTVSGVEFNPPRRVFSLHETVHREEFRLRADPALDGQTARGRLSVYRGAVLIAEVGLAIKVDSRHAAATTYKSMESESARPYRRVFASYSHKDSWIVGQFEQLARATGDEFLRDCNQLRAGEVWNDRLLRLIESADVFQLFWSRNSMQSEFVRREWEHALSLQRPNFIRPTYWEQPFPEDQRTGLPPESLRQLHFQPLTFADAEPKRPAQQPKESPTVASLPPNMSPPTSQRSDTPTRSTLPGTDPEIFLPNAEQDSGVQSIPAPSRGHDPIPSQAGRSDSDFDLKCAPGSAPPSWPTSASYPRYRTRRARRMARWVIIAVAIICVAIWLILR